MAEVLQAWLADAGVEASNLEQVTSWALQPCQIPAQAVEVLCWNKGSLHLASAGAQRTAWQAEAHSLCWLAVHHFMQDFASGWLFGKLLAGFNLQPDHSKFVNKGKPDAYLANYTRLQVSVAVAEPSHMTVHPTANPTTEISSYCCAPE
jgi:hypothetical protein